jgi:hypothetical protein
MKSFKINLILLILIIILSRLIAFGVLDYWDIINDSGLAIKPLGWPAYLDYTIYLTHINSAWDEIYRPFLFFQYALIDTAEAWRWLQDQNAKPGPIFSNFLGLAGIDTLGWAYIFMGCLLGFGWAKFFEWRGLGLWAQALVACFPALIYYSFLLSTDLLYAVLVAIFYATSWYVLSHNKGAWILSILIMMILLLVRPNALSLIPILFIILAKDSTLKWYIKVFLISTCSLMGGYMLIYYLPYFWLHEANSATTSYWGIYSQQYHQGIFPWLPLWINQFTSLLLLVISKFLYSVGLRPSYSDISLWLVFIRALPSVLLLPGLIYGFWRGNWFDCTFILFFLIPVYLGAAQERYLLSITPLLLFWGVHFYSAIFKQWNIQYLQKVSQ